MITQELYDWMQDWDNWDLSSDERRDQLEQSVTAFNEAHETNHSPKNAFLDYEEKRRKPEH